MVYNGRCAASVLFTISTKARMPDVRNFSLARTIPHDAAGLRREKVQESHTRAAGMRTRHLGQEGDTNAGSNHRQQRIKLATLEHYVGAQSRSLADVQNIVSKAVAVLEQQEGLVGDVSEGNPAPALAPQSMASRHRQEHAIIQQRLRLQLGTSSRQAQQGQV
jgi:hypothetical protein